MKNELTEKELLELDAPTAEDLIRDEEAWVRMISEHESAGTELRSAIKNAIAMMYSLGDIQQMVNEEWGKWPFVKSEKEQTKYYRLMEKPEETWMPYQYAPMYDEHPEYGSYRSTLYLSTPRKGDYLVREPNGEVFAERPTNLDEFDEVRFSAMPSLEDLLKKGIIVEVPESIMATDYDLQQKLSDLGEECSIAEDALFSAESNMQRKNKIGFPTKEARECKKYYKQIKPKVDELNRQYAELEAELQEKVVKPLMELAQKQSEKQAVGLDQQIDTASGRCQQHLNRTHNSLELAR